MQHRPLGRSGLLVSEISYGNWITHGSQVEKETAIACVRAALEEGITTFDTADIYAKTKAELEKELARLRNELKVPDDVPPHWFGNQGRGGGKKGKQGKEN